MWDTVNLLFSVLPWLSCKAQIIFVRYQIIIGFSTIKDRHWSSRLWSLNVLLFSVILKLCLIFKMCSQVTQQNTWNLFGFSKLMSVNHYLILKGDFSFSVLLFLAPTGALEEGIWSGLCVRVSVTLCTEWLYKSFWSILASKQAGKQARKPASEQAKKQAGKQASK